MRRSRSIMPFTCAADRIMNDQAGALTPAKHRKELTEELDLAKPLIVIDHEPRELNELSRQERIWIFADIPMMDRSFPSP
ncbi:MAG: hypothetical protein ACLUUO_09025 [Sellimonas intestinalis]